MNNAEDVIRSRTNSRVKQLRAAFSGHARLSSGLVAIEGEHLLEEALRSGMALKTVFLSEHRPRPAKLPAMVETIRLAEEVFASAVETQSPQGVAALLVPPVWHLEDILRGEPLLLIAVELQDPGNLGTLVRSAEAFGATAVITTPGTVSPWNQKAVRASAGSVFRLPILTLELVELKSYKLRGMKYLAAVLDSSVDASCEVWEGARGILIGNEGKGLPKPWLDLADARVTIPFSSNVDSLNAGVAGSILLYIASRQRVMTNTGART